MAGGEPTDFVRLRGALRFGDDPTQYERARPAHPAWVFDAVLDGIGPCRVVDVGCGTGVAALELRKRGCEVVGVEPDKRMAAVAVERGLAVEVATFEAWDPAGREFAVVCSAQAWHWVDATVGLERAAAVLRPGGRFAAFWYGHRHEPEVAAAVRAARGLPSAASTEPRDPASSTREAISSRPDLFGAVDTRRSSASIAYSADQWLEVEASMGANRALPEGQRERLFAALHAVIRELEPITVHWDTTLITATRDT